MESISPERLQPLRVLILSHVYATGPPQDLEEYLVPRVAALTFIGHPFPYAQDRQSFWRRYRSGARVASGVFRDWRGPALSFYLKDVLLTLFWVGRSRERYDLAVCADGLNTLCGLLLRFFGRADRVVFYCIDWTPRRFPSRFFNALYHALDRLAVTSADRTWNLSPRMAEGRAARGLSRSAGQRIVPVGVFLKRFPPPVPRPRPSQRVVFLGHLREGQGLRLLLRAFERAAAPRPNAELVLVGGGPLATELRSAAGRSPAAPRIHFVGFLPDPREVERVLMSCDLAVAPYEPDSFTQYTDPGKPKVYLACGLPVLITDVPAVAAEIESAGAGMIVPSNEAALAETMGTLLDDPARLAQMRARAYALAHSFDWEGIFSAALADVLS